MSSLKEVIVIPLATFGSATNVPAPRRRVRRPSRTSSSSAARKVSRETPELDAEHALGRDRVADLERLDQLEHLLAGLALLRHRGARQLGGGGCGASRGSRRPVSRSKNWRRRGSTASSTRSPTRRRRARVDAGREQRAAMPGRARVRRRRPRATSAVIERASTVKKTCASEPSSSSTSTTTSIDGRLGRERGVLEALGPDAEDHGARQADVSAGREAGCCTGRTRRRPSSTVASTRFMAGEPMNPATKTSRGSE